MTAPVRNGTTAGVGGGGGRRCGRQRKANAYTAMKGRAAEQACGADGGVAVMRRPREALSSGSCRSACAKEKSERGAARRHSITCRRGVHGRAAEQRCDVERESNAAGVRGMRDGAVACARAVGRKGGRWRGRRGRGRRPMKKVDNTASMATSTASGRARLVPGRAASPSNNRIVLRAVPRAPRARRRV